MVRTTPAPDTGLEMVAPAAVVVVATMAQTGLVVMVVLAAAAAVVIKAVAEWADWAAAADHAVPVLVAMVE